MGSFSAQRSRRSPAGGPLLELLESRQLLSMTLDGTTLTVEGTESADTVLVRRNGTGTNYRVSLNGDTQSFAVGSIDRFIIRTLGGNDAVEYDETNGLISARSRVELGDGNDRAFTGSGKDTLLGGDGRDYLHGGDGNDKLVGANGNDVLIGGADDDRLYGNRDDDRAYGRGGDDRLIGAGGNDLLKGHGGADYIEGRSGRDTIKAGGGHDQLFGGGGNDSLEGNSGRDVIGGDEENTFTFVGQTAKAPKVSNDTIVGGNGNDILLAHFGVDSITGGDGGDLFDARGGDDTLVDRDPGESVPSSAVFNGAPAVDLEATLRIFVNGEQVQIPDGAGAFAGGTSIAQAVDDDGTIRFRDAVPRAFFLSDFFQAWGVAFDPSRIGRFNATPANPITMTVNGVANTDFEDYAIVADGDVVEIHFG